MIHSIVQAGLNSGHPLHDRKKSSMNTLSFKTWSFSNTFIYTFTYVNYPLTKRSTEPHSQHWLHRRRSPLFIQSSSLQQNINFTFSFTPGNCATHSTYRNKVRERDLHLLALNLPWRVQNATQTRGYPKLCAAVSIRCRDTTSPSHCC